MEFIADDGVKVLLDLDDYDLVSKYKWRTSSRGYSCSYPINKDGKYITLSMHKLILLGSDYDKKIQVDHINGNKLDNRKENLRPCNNAENNRNKKITKANKSGYKGVSWYKAYSKWRARIMINGKEISLGYHDNINNAALAYNEAAVKYHGEFANLNDVPRG